MIADLRTLDAVASARAQDEGIATNPVPARGRGRPPASNGHRTERRILDTAREVFAELGYERTTFQEIASRAGVTRPAVNHYFRGKAALYEAVFDSTQEGVVTAALERAAAADSATGRLGAFLHGATQADAQDRSFARFLAASLVDGFRHPEFAPRARGQIDEVRGFVRRTLQEGMRSGEVRADLDLDATTEMLVAMMWGMGLYAGFVGTHDQLEVVVEQFERVLVGALRVMP